MTFHEKCVNIKKIIDRANLYPSVHTDISNFVKTARENLFGCCACKCESLELCNCSQERRVPEQRNFLTDQRTLR